jgi:hypothetical protein
VHWPAKWRSLNRRSIVSNTTLSPKLASFSSSVLTRSPNAAGGKVQLYELLVGCCCQSIGRISAWRQAIDKLKEGSIRMLIKGGYSN